MAALFFLAPLMLIVALAVFAHDGGPIVFAHRRIGRNGKTFPCFKFRSMAIDAEQRLAEVLARDPQARAEWEADHKLRDDPRVTRLGAFLRKTSLDELPQLFNVLRGEMSLVGPRPIVAAEICQVRPAFQALLRGQARHHGPVAGERPQRHHLSPARRHGLRVRQGPATWAWTSWSSP